MLICTRGRDFRPHCIALLRYSHSPLLSKVPLLSFSVLLFSSLSFSSLLLLSSFLPSHSTHSHLLRVLFRYLPFPFLFIFICSSSTFHSSVLSSLPIPASSLLLISLQPPPPHCIIRLSPPPLLPVSLQPLLGRSSSSPSLLSSPLLYEHAILLIPHRRLISHSSPRQVVLAFVLPSHAARLHANTKQQYVSRF